MNTISLGDRGFAIEFTTEIDLTDATRVSFGVLKTDGSETLRDLAAADYNTVEAGGTVLVMVEAADFDITGQSLAQLYAQKGSELELSSWPPVVIEVEPRLTGWEGSG